MVLQMHLKIILTALFLTTSVGCTTVYYNFWEMFGQEKRDLLKSNISDAKDDQTEVEEQIKDTLKRIRTEYKFDGGSLEVTYDRLKKDYDQSKARADTLSDRIDKVEEIAGDLFEEWEDEADEITNKNYRRDSLAKRQETMARFATMLKSMRSVEKKLEPILVKFNDQVLYLKHNLNAKALGAFKTEFLSIESEIDTLIQSMNQSSKAADQFISQMNGASNS
jgi:chromosome segregation ATPase